MLSFFGFLGTCLLQEWSARSICLVSGMLFLILGILRFWFQRPLMFYLPFLQGLYNYERQRLGPNFILYYKSGVFVLLLLSFLSFLQAWLRRSAIPWIWEMPLSYWFVMFISLLLMVNIQMFFHMKWLRKWTTEKWTSYAQERQLLLKVILIVLSGILMVGALIYDWLVNIQDIRIKY